MPKHSPAADAMRLIVRFPPYVALVAFLSHGPAGGAFFVAALAAYTLVRQGILGLRAEQRKTRLGGLVTAVPAALVFIAAIVWLAR